MRNEQFKRFGSNLAHFLKRTPCLLFAEILMTYNCTQRCLQCNIPQKKDKIRTIDPADFFTVLDRLARYGTQGLILSGGEPTSHPHLKLLIEAAAKKNFLYKLLLTNLYFSEQRMDNIADLIFTHRFHVTCSFDGFGATVDKIRGGKNVAGTVIRNMAYLSRENKRRGYPVKTIANIVVSKLNLHQIPEIVAYLDELGWMINIDLYRNSSVNHNQVDEMEIHDFAELRPVLDSAKTEKRLITPGWILNGYESFMKGAYPKQCPYLSNRSLGSKFYIHPNGAITTCIGGAVGNILQQEIDELFSSTAWQEKQQEFKNCSGCWNTCYTPAAKLSNYFKVSELKNVYSFLKH